MKVTITADRIEIETDDDDMPINHERTRGLPWSCRIAAHEACAWAIKRLGEEMEKSVQFYRTGDATDNISID